MDQSEDREEGVPPSKTTLSGEHENQTRDQRIKDRITEWLVRTTEAADINQVLKRKTVQRSIKTGGRKKRPKYETTGTTEKRMDEVTVELAVIQAEVMENELNVTNDLINECKDALKAWFKLTGDELYMMTGRLKECEDTLMRWIELDRKHDGSESDTVLRLSLLMSIKTTLEMLLAKIKVMDNKLYMTDEEEEYVEVTLVVSSSEVKRLEDEGSDSTESEHEPREEPSSHTDSDGKSSCVSFNSDGSMYRLIEFKDSGPSALKRKQLQNEGSDSTESEHEPREEPSSHSDSDGNSSCVSFNGDRSMNRIIDFKDSGPSAPKRKRLEEKRST